LETKLTIKGKIKNALIDSGASFLFMDRQFVADMGIQLDELPTPIAVKIIDGSDLKRGDVTALVEIDTCLGLELFSQGAPSTMGWLLVWVIKKRRSDNAANLLPGHRIATPSTVTTTTLSPSV
jgi:hypothetical protein